MNFHKPRQSYSILRPINYHRLLTDGSLLDI